MENDVYEASIQRVVRRYSDKIASKASKTTLEQAMAAHETALQAAELRPSIWKDWLRFETPEP